MHWRAGHSRAHGIRVPEPLAYMSGALQVSLRPVGISFKPVVSRRESYVSGLSKAVPMAEPQLPAPSCRVARLPEAVALLCLSGNIYTRTVRFIDRSGCGSINVHMMKNALKNLLLRFFLRCPFGCAAGAVPGIAAPTIVTCGHGCRYATSSRSRAKVEAYWAKCYPEHINLARLCGICENQVMGPFTNKYEFNVPECCSLERLQYGCTHHK